MFASNYEWTSMKIRFHTIFIGIYKFSFHFDYYRPQTKFAKVMFLQASVILLTWGGVRGCSRGGVRGFIWGGHAWFYPGGACVVLFGGRAWFYSGGCMVLSGGRAWFYPGGHAWFYSGGVHGFIRGACVVFQFFRIQ